jgi:hypothetical protein
LHGLAIADSLLERLRWSEYFCYLRPPSGEKRVSFLEHTFYDHRLRPSLNRRFTSYRAFREPTLGTQWQPL